MARVEVTNKEEVTYVYDYDELEGIQIMKATSVFVFHNNHVMNMPRSVREMEAAEDAEYMSNAFKHLLMRKLSTGQLEPYDSKRVKETKAFIEALKSEEFDKLEVAKKDFFLRRKLQEPELMQQLTPLIGALPAELLMQAQTEQTRQNGYGENMKDYGNFGNQEDTAE